MSAHSGSTLRIAAALCASMMALPSQAASPQSSGVDEMRVLKSTPRPSTESRLEERLAQDWGLKPDEWARFRALMRGPLGLYSPNLDPLTALGIEARSDAERRRFAELQVRAEGRRVEKLLAYQRAYDEAWQRIHPTLLPMKSSTTDPPRKFRNTSAAQDSKRLMVFVKNDCTVCEQEVKELQAAGRAFDLYMVGSRQEDSRIRAWATLIGIDPAKVRARTITLNHDAGRWLSIGGQGSLPAILQQVDGQWQRQ